MLWPSHWSIFSNNLTVSLANMPTGWGRRFNMNMSYRQMVSYNKDKTVSRPFHLHHGNPFDGKKASSYWTGLQVIANKTQRWSNYLRVIWQLNCFHIKYPGYTAVWGTKSSRFTITLLLPGANQKEAKYTNLSNCWFTISQLFGFIYTRLLNHYRLSIAMILPQ